MSSASWRCERHLTLYRPAFVRLSAGLAAAVFPLMKVYPAFECVRDADEAGRIDRSTLIVESSSGTMALGLALVCRWAGYSLAVVGDASCDALVRLRLRELGASLECVTADSHHNLQRARLAKVAELCAAHPRSWWVNQYDNPANGRAYARFVQQAAAALDRIDCVVGTVGSGGSMCGTVAALRERSPHLIAIGVDTYGSVLFGQENRPRVLRGLGNSLMPGNLDHQAFDEVHWVTAAEAYTATRLLHRTTGLFRGGTSGACWLVAQHWAARHPRARTLCLFADDGHRYVDSIYDDAYLAQERLWLDALPTAPVEVESPRDAGPRWTFMHWGRRPYEEVTGLDRQALACLPVDAGMGVPSEARS